MNINMTIEKEKQEYVQDLNVENAEENENSASLKCNICVKSTFVCLFGFMYI